MIKDISTIDTTEILDKLYKVLADKGIFYISLKYGNYREIMKEDELGIRTNYFYSPEEIEKLAGKRYKTIYKEIQDLRGQKLFKIVLKKM